jgi:hypothetical protein
MTTPDIAGLCKRLRLRAIARLSWKHPSHTARDDAELDTTTADTLERQAAEIERLQEVVDELIKLDTGPKIRLRRSGPTDIRIEAPTGEDQ